MSTAKTCDFLERGAEDKRASQCCPARCLCWDQRSCIRVAPCARRSGRSLLGHAGQAPLIRPCSRCSCSSAQRRSGFLAFRCCVVSFSRRRGERHARSASVRLRALGPGWPPPGTPGLALPPLLLNTRAKNLYDLKSRRGKPIIIRHPSPKSPMI